MTKRPQAVYIFAALLALGLHAAFLLASPALRQPDLQIASQAGSGVEIELLPSVRQAQHAPVASTPEPQKAESAPVKKQEPQPLKENPPLARQKQAAAQDMAQPHNTNSAAPQTDDVPQSVTSPQQAEKNTKQAVQPAVAAQERNTPARNTKNEAAQNAAPDGAAAPNTSAALDNSASAVASEPVPLNTLDNPSPKYPKLARQRGQEGEVLLRVAVSSRGEVTHIAVERGSGHKLLDEEALKTVKKWRFSPARKNGRPVDGKGTVLVEFRLSQE